MLKTQKTFSPLDCSLCKFTFCRYHAHYEELYRAGIKIKISDCARLAAARRKK